MKILMIGLGSIGQRHVRNLRAILGERAELLAYRSRGLRTTLTDRLEIREGVDLETEYGITSYTDLEEALAQRPELVFITTITAKHMEYALRAAEAGCHLFIEKPLSHSLEGIEQLEKLKQERGIRVFLGFQNRYHPCVLRMKEALESGRLGQIRSVSCEFSERVTSMHRYEDYRGTYIARSEMGGGPVLNLLMHDLDLLCWLFGAWDDVRSQLLREPSLEINVEAGADAIVRFAGDVSVSLHTDLLQYPPVHRIKVVGEQGRLEADMGAVSYTEYVGDEPARSWRDPTFARNEMFLRELADLLQCVEQGTEEAIGLSAGIESLRLGRAILEGEDRR